MLVCNPKPFPSPYHGLSVSILFDCMMEMEELKKHGEGLWRRREWHWVSTLGLRQDWRQQTGYLGGAWLRPYSPYGEKEVMMMMVEYNVVSRKKKTSQALCAIQKTNKSSNKQIVGKLTGESNYKLLTLQQPRLRRIPYQLWRIGTFHQCPVSSNEGSFYHGDLSSVWLSSVWIGLILLLFFQATLLQVLEYHVEWLEEIGFSHNQVITN